MTGVMIGAGYFARFQAEAWKRLPVEIVAVADAVKERAAAFAKEFGIASVYRSVEEMLAKERPDFVDLVTRPETHLELTTMAARAGADVICQKPMAPSLRECEAICEVCERAKVRLLIHENWRWQPWYREVKRFLNEGGGYLSFLDFFWSTGDGKGLDPYAAQPYFRTMPRLLIYESLIHVLDTFRFLGGEFRVTGCEARRLNPVIAGEDAATIELTFASGADGLIRADRVNGPVPAPLAMGTMAVGSREGVLKVLPDGIVRLAKPGKAEEQVVFVPPQMGYKGDSVYATQQHLLECLRTGAVAESEGREYLKTMALVDDCYRLAGKVKNGDEN